MAAGRRRDEAVRHAGTGAGRPARRAARARCRRRHLPALGARAAHQPGRAAGGADPRLARRQGAAGRHPRRPGGRRRPPPPPRHGEPLGNRVLHKDVGLALLSSFAAVLAICLCCAAWIVTAWPSGAAAAMFAAVFCSFFATMDDPVPAIRNFMTFMIWSVPVSALYVLVLLPLVHDFGMLVLVIAPTFLLLGLCIARAATAPSAMAMLFGIAGTLSMHDTQAVVDLPAFLNSMLAQGLGIFAAALVTRLVRTVGADWSAQRIRRATWSELGAMADAARGAAVDEAYAVRMVDRIAL